MANDGQHHDSPEASWVDEFDEVLRTANPNPARVGCPSRDVLIAASRRERPLGDPAYEHLLKCSPCYSEFRALQQTGLPSHADASGRIWWLGAAATVLLVAAGAVWFVGQRTPERQVATRESVAPPTELRTELDLRKYAVVRSDQRAPELPPVSLPRGRLSLTILLPVGSEPGPYELQILDSDLRSKAAAIGNAEIREYVTTFRATIELASLAPGTYQLALRRQGEEWRLFPADLK